MDVTVDQLQALLTVLDSGSFEAAATRLGITQPAVSHRIKSLEKAVGRTLVVRSKPLRPTDSGQVLLRLARQTRQLYEEVQRELDGDPQHSWTSLCIVVNADSLSTWALPALAEATTRLRIALDIRREDQAHSVELLRDGTTMATITSHGTALPGCRVRRLGVMRYRAAATPAFVRQWFSDGVTTTSLNLAPMIVFDTKDDLQDAFIRKVTRSRVQPPRHYVPDSAQFTAAVRLAMGWGMVPDQHRTPGDDLVELVPGRPVDVPLFWQQWKLSSPALDALADAVASAAHRALP